MSLVELVFDTFFKFILSKIIYACIIISLETYARI